MSSLTIDLMERYPETIDQIFNSLGLNTFINYFAFIPMTILGSIGLIGNCLVVLLSQRLTKKLPLVVFYKYMVLLSINCSVTCLMFIFNFMVYSIRSFPWISSKESAIFGCYVYISVTSCCYFYNTILSILILLDRLYVLRGKQHFIPNRHVYKACIVSLFIVITLDLPFFLSFSYDSKLIDLYSVGSNGSVFTNESLLISYVAKTVFSNSLEGEILNICLSVLRDGLLMIAEIILSLLVLFHFRVYMIQKSRINSNSVSYAESTYKSQARMTKMTICISVLSILEHMLTLVTVIVPYTSFYTLANLVTLSAIVYFCYCVKYSINFLVLFIFNSNYRTELKEIFKLCQ